MTLIGIILAYFLGVTAGLAVGYQYGRRVQEQQLRAIEKTAAELMLSSLH